MCSSVNRLHKDMKYSLDSVLYFVYERLASDGCDFDYVWLIEDDVYCDGNLDACLEMSSDDEKDFLATFVEDYDVHKNGDWVWWNDVTKATFPLEERVKSFFPVTRYSKRFLECIHDHIGEESGFCEVYIPSLAKNRGYTYGNIEERCVGNMSLGVIRPMPTNGDNRLYHKWQLNM